MTKLQWAYCDEESRDLPHAGDDWSRPKSVENAIADLAKRQDLMRPVTITITCCLAEVNAEAGSIILRPAGSTAEPSFMSIEAPAPRKQRTLPRDITPSSDGSSTLLSDALRVCMAGASLDSGHAMAKWMWNDPGLTPWIPQWIHLAKHMGFRWSRWQSLETTAMELQRLKGTKDEHRPVRMVVFPDVSISFECIANSVVDACMALAELTGNGSQELTAYEDMVSTCSHYTVSWRTLSRQDSFMSVVDCMSDDEHQEITGGLTCKGKAFVRSSSRKYSFDDEPNLPPKLPSKNKNKISHFQWTAELLDKIAKGAAGNMVRDSDKKSGTALFVVAGSCPNFASPMQAVVYSQVAGAIDFWWIKPQAADSTRLEHETLNLHSKGPFKNSPGRSSEVYAPIAEKFAGSEDEHGDLRFGVDASGRAFIEENRSCGERKRLLIYLVWQEELSSLFSRGSKHLQGKLFYQLCDPDCSCLPAEAECCFYSRQYRIESSSFSIAPWQEEEQISTLLPPDSAQDMYAMTNSSH